MPAVKRLLVLLVLVGCAATPARDASLVLQRMHAQLQVIEVNNDYAAARALMTKTRDEYRDIIGESVLFDRLTALSVEAIDLDEQKALAIKNGTDPAPYLAKRGPLMQEISNLVPRVMAEIQQAQKDADRRAQNATAFANTLGAMIGGFAGAVAGSSADSASASTYQAPAPTPPAATNCTVLPAGRNTVTGQSYGSYVYCR